jgi:hypothetical protein
MRTLSYVLADGFQEDARLDVDQLVVKALREPGRAHVRVLMWGSKQVHLELTSPGLATSVPGLIEGLSAFWATLERTGCIARSDDVSSGGRQHVVLTEFGRTCLNSSTAKVPHCSRATSGEPASTAQRRRSRIAAGPPHPSPQHCPLDVRRLNGSSERSFDAQAGPMRMRLYHPRPKRL